MFFTQKRTFISGAAVLLAALLLWAPAPAAPEKKVPYFLQDEPKDAPDRVHEALDLWEPELARKELDAIPPGAIDPTLSIYLEARIAFLEGNYEYASKLLEDIKRTGKVTGEGIDHFNDFVANTLKQTKSFEARESEHFKIFYEPGPDQILVEPALETLEKQYNALSDVFHIKLPGRIRVEIAPSGHAFLTLSDIDKKAVETTGTIALCKYNRLIVTSPRSLPRGYNWRDTAAHELTHYFIYKRTRNGTPIWLHEGLARYFESIWRGGPLGDITPSDETLLFNALQKDKIIPLKRMHPSFVYLDSAEEGAQAFAQTDTIVEYLHLKVGNGGFDILNKVLDNLANGHEYELAIAAGTGVSFDAFYKGWIEYLKTRKMRVVKHTHIEEVRLAESEEDKDKQDIESLDSERVRDLVRVGDLLKNRGRFAGAAEEYQKALDVFGVSPIIINKLAFALVQSNQPDKAIAPLELANENFPGYGAIYKRLGEVYSLKQDWKRASEYFRQALDINPFDVEVQQMIAAVYTKLEDKAGAERHLKALELLGR